jgi:hypothetical protein
MTEKDNELIDSAAKLKAIDWSLVSALEEQAESDEAKRILHNRQVFLYRKEEYSAGLL